MYVKMVSKTKVLYYSLILMLLLSKNKINHMLSHISKIGSSLGMFQPSMCLPPLMPTMFMLPCVASKMLVTPCCIEDLGTIAALNFFL